MDGERHIEMTWRCAGCEAVCLGRFKRCPGCGKPKEAEEYEMPADTASAATVTDADSLRMATAGPDWRCAYCGTDQRASDGSCGQCGASAPDAADDPDLLEAALAPDTPSTRRAASEAREAYDPAADVMEVPWWARAAPRRRSPYPILLGCLLALVGVLALVVWNRSRPHHYEGTVVAVAWTRTIDVDHYANHDHEGFREEIPDDATDVTSVGQKVHHQEQVFDHMETEHYTEEVPDGFRTESYTESVACGDSCTTTAPTCSEQCTSKKNGFASCRQVCSGGGRSCSPKYCSESHTRQIPQTRSVDRTRQVARYRSEPRYAEAFHYKHWDWAHDRTVRAAGTEATGLAWPDNGAKTTGLPEGDQEREERHATYRVTLRYDDHNVELAPTSPEALAPFTTHSTHAVRRVEQALYVDDRLMTPVSGP